MSTLEYLIDKQREIEELELDMRVDRIGAGCLGAVITGVIPLTAISYLYAVGGGDLTTIVGGGAALVGTLVSAGRALRAWHDNITRNENLHNGAEINDQKVVLKVGDATLRYDKKVLEEEMNTIYQANMHQRAISFLEKVKRTKSGEADRKEEAIGYREMLKVKATPSSAEFSRIVGNIISFPVSLISEGRTPKREINFQLKKDKVEHLLMQRLRLALKHGDEFYKKAYNNRTQYTDLQVESFKGCINSITIMHDITERILKSTKRLMDVQQRLYRLNYEPA